MLTGKEKDLLYDIFEFYIQNKLEKQSVDISVFTDLAHDTGDLGDVGELYEKTKHLHDLKHKLREHVQTKKGKVSQLRNKLYDLLKF